jgi:hypothetical protein
VKGIVCAVAAVVALSFGVARAASPNSVDVTPVDMNGWAFFDDNTGLAGSGAMVYGPATPPRGVGSAQLSVTGPADRQALGSTAFSGTALSALTSLEYWSYQSGPMLALALQFDVRYHPADTTYGGRLVFEPYQQGGVVPAGWTHWTAVAGAAGGKWWASKTSTAGSNGLCSQASPCTWAQVRANWPDASIRGAVLFKAGGGWPSFTGNVDAFTIGVLGASTTYNFDPAKGQSGAP